MSQSHSPLKALAEAIQTTARHAARGVVQVRARGARPATAALVADDLVAAPLHGIERDQGLVVVAGDATWDAQVVGRDEALDLILLRAPGLGAAPWTPAPGRADATDAGQIGVAVARGWQGNLVARLATVTGETCPVRRWRAEPLPGLLRTDVPPARGVSGGVLVDPDGALLGWLTCGLGRGQALALPAPLLADRVARLVAHGRIRRGYVGLAVQAVTLPPAQNSTAAQGLLVSGLDHDGPGTAAGLLVGDILVQADDVALLDPSTLQGLLPEERIGGVLSLRVLRATTVHELSVTVGERQR